MYGDPDSTGKPAGDDLTEGKRTVLVALALARAPGGDAKRLDEALGTALSVEEVADLRRIIDESGAHAEVERRIEDLTTESLAALEAAAVTPASRGRAPRARGRRHPAHPLTELSGGGVAQATPTPDNSAG